LLLAGLLLYIFALAQHCSDSLNIHRCTTGNAAWMYLPPFFLLCTCQPTQILTRKRVNGVETSCESGHYCEFCGLWPLLPKHCMTHLYLHQFFFCQRQRRHNQGKKTRVVQLPNELLTRLWLRACLVNTNLLQYTSI
jgi:hypothetical protein